MDEKIKHRIYLIAVLFLALFRFYELGSMEVQPWDEAMYGVRAFAVIDQDEWLDQTKYSCGGLYSSVHPPLYIWLTAITHKLLDDRGAEILRFWSALCGAGLILLIFLFHRDKLTGLFSSIILAMLPLFHFYTRQGQIDIMLVFFVMLSAFLFYKNENDPKLLLLILSGVAFGLALMAKALVGFILPVSIAIYLIVRIYTKKENWKTAIYKLSIISFIGILIALPWHYYMYLSHGTAFTNQLFGYHLLERAVAGVEHNVKETGSFFYINQLIVMMSVSLLPAFIALRHIREHKLILLSIITFAVSFIIFSISQTKLQTYSLPMLPPLAILAGFGFKALWEKKGISPVFIILTVLLAMWSFSQQLRIDFKLFIGSGEISNTLIYSAVIFVVIIAFLRILYLVIIRTNKGVTKNLSPKIKSHNSSNTPQPFLPTGRDASIASGGFNLVPPFSKIGLGATFLSKSVVIAMLIFLTINFIANPREPYYKSNIENAATTFYKQEYSSLAYIETINYSGAVNPQLDYYFGGISKELEQIFEYNRKFNYIQTLKDTYYINDIIDKSDMIIVKMKDKNNQIDSLNKIIENKTRSFSSDDIYNIYINDNRN